MALNFISKGFLAIILACIILPIKTHNTGNICGTVSDSKKGIPLIGVNTQIKNSLIGTTTDLNGKYELKNIQFGTYEIVFFNINAIQ